MPRRQGVARNLGREQQVLRVGQRQPPSVPGHGEDIDAAAARERPGGPLEQVVEPDAAPILGRIPAAGAVQDGADRVPAVEVVNPTGSGDLLLAGLAVGIERGWSPREALVLGAACGTAGATYLLPELPPGFDPDAWTPRIRVESLEPGA